MISSRSTNSSFSTSSSPAGSAGTTRTYPTAPLITSDPRRETPLEYVPIPVLASARSPTPSARPTSKFDVVSKDLPCSGRASGATTPAGLSSRARSAAADASRPINLPVDLYDVITGQRPISALHEQQDQDDDEADGSPLRNRTPNGKRSRVGTALKPSGETIHEVDEEKLESDDDDEGDSDEEDAMSDVGEDDSGMPPGERLDGSSFSTSTKASNPASSIVLPITIPHGFQLQRTLLHGKAAVRMVVFTPPPGGNELSHHVPKKQRNGQHDLAAALGNPNSDAFASMDNHYLHVWRGTARVRRRPLGENIELGREDRIPIREGGSGLGGLVDPITQWVYIRKYRLYVVSTDRLELKVLDHNLAELTKIPSEKPVLTMDVNDHKNEVIIGCVGGVWIWEIFREPESVANHTIYTLKGPRLVLNQLTEDEWVTRTMYRHSTNQLYVACDNSVHIFNYDTGEKVDSMSKLHELSITHMVVHEGSDFLITGAKDGLIKVWNSQRLLVCAFAEHAGAISGLALPLELSHMTRPPPILLSASFDGSLRLWDIEKGRCIYRQPTQAKILGMGMMRRDVFYHFTSRAIYVWHLNRLVSTFVQTQSPVTHLMRVVGPSREINSSTGGLRRARLVVVCEDGSVRLLSPRTGGVLVTCFPTFQQAFIVDVIHDLPSELVYTLMSSGEIITYDVTVNPAKVVRTVQTPHIADIGRLTCMAPLPDPLTVLGGTSNGQVVLVDLVFGQHRPLTQGHIGDVTCMYALGRDGMVVTCSNDKTVKTWRYDRAARYLESIHVVNSIAFPMRLRLAPGGHGRATSPSLGSASSARSGSNRRATYILASHTGTVSVHEAVPAEGGTVTINAGQSVQFPSSLSKSASHFSSSINVSSHSSLPNISSVVIAASTTGTVGKVWVHSQDEDHTKPITGLDHLKSLNIFVTGGLDGVVKVWSGENVLVREVQVGEPVTSVAFCNARGDLLIGVHDEVSMLRWRDYMPTTLAYTVQSMNIPEDPYEDPVPFDTGLDFWGGFRDQPGFDLEQWHLCMYNIKPDETLFESDLMQMFHQDLVRGHPDRHTSTRQGLIARSTASPTKETTSKVDPETNDESRRANRGPIVLTGMEPIPQSTSVDDELDTLLTEMTKKTYAALAAADMDSQVWDQLDQLMKADAGAHAQLQYFIRTKKVIPPVFQPPPGTEADVTAVGAIQQYRDEHKISEIEEKTKEIARKMKAAGAKTVANSMAQGSMDPRDEEAAKAAAAMRAAASKKKHMKHKSKRAAAGAATGKPKKREKTAESVTMRRRKSHLPDSDDEDTRSHGYDGSEAEDRANDRGQQPAEDEGDDGDNDLDIDDPPPPRPPSQPPIQELPPKPAPPEKKPRHAPPPPPRLPTPPPAPVEPTPPSASPQPEPPVQQVEPPPQPFPAPSPPKKVVLPPSLPTRPSVPPPVKKPPLTSRLLTPKKPAPASPPKVPSFKARPPPATLKSPPAPPKRTPTAPEAPTPRPPSRLLKPPKEEDVVVWNILRHNNQQGPKRDLSHHPTASQAHERRQQRTLKAKEMRMAQHINRTRIPIDPSHPGAGIRHVPPGEAEPKLGKVTALSWFPGLDGQDVTVTNVTHVLGDLVRGVHRRKPQTSAANILAARIEATKMLAYVYRVFGRDIRDPMATVILPLVETMHADPEWMIRAQIAAVVPRLGLYHPDLISGLVARLADMEEQVRKAAMNSLAFFGITTSEALSAAMVKLGLLPQGWTAQGFKPAQKKHRSILDAMYDEVLDRQAKERRASVDKVNEWLKGTQMRYTDRLASED